MVLTLLLFSCAFAVEQQGSVLWPHWSGMPAVSRHAEQGPPNQHQQADAFQSAGADGVGSLAAQIIAAEGIQSQADDTQLLQAQTANVFVGQKATKKIGGPGWANAYQSLRAGQQQAASSTVGQAGQNQFVAVTQHSYVAGMADSTASVVGNVGVSVNQWQSVN